MAPNQRPHHLFLLVVDLHSMNSGSNVSPKQDLAQDPCQRDIHVSIVIRFFSYIMRDQGTTSLKEINSTNSGIAPEYVVTST